MAAHQFVVPTNLTHSAYFFNLTTPQWVAQTRTNSLWLFLRSAHPLLAHSAQSPHHALASLWDKHRMAALTVAQRGFSTPHHPRALGSGALLASALRPAPTPTFTFSLPRVGSAPLAWLRCDFGRDSRCGQWLWVTRRPRHHPLSRALE